MARLITMVVFATMLLGAIVWTSGCGAATPELAPSTTVLAVADAAPDTLAIQKYGDELQDWVETYWTSADYGAFDLEDLSFPTDSEVERMHEFADSMHVSVSALKKISAPNPITQAHAHFYTAVASDATAIDRLIMAIENQNQRDAELAFRRMSEARTIGIQAMQALEPYLDQPAIMDN